MNGQKEGGDGNRELTPPSKRAEQIVESFLGTSFERGRKEGRFIPEEVEEFFARHDSAHPDTRLSLPEKDYITQCLRSEGVLREKEGDNVHAGA